MLSEFGCREIEYLKITFKFSKTKVRFEIFKEWILDLEEKYEKDRIGRDCFDLGKFFQYNEMKSIFANPHYVKKTKN